MRLCLLSFGDEQGVFLDSISVYKVVCDSRRAMPAGEVAERLSEALKVPLVRVFVPPYEGWSWDDGQAVLSLLPPVFPGPAVLDFGAEFRPGRTSPEQYAGLGPCIVSVRSERDAEAAVLRCGELRAVLKSGERVVNVPADPGAVDEYEMNPWFELRVWSGAGDGEDPGHVYHDLGEALKGAVAMALGG